MLYEAVLSASHWFRYEVCTLTIVTAILFQNIWFPQRLLKLLGCRGQLILLAALILHSLSLWYL